MNAVFSNEAQKAGCRHIYLLAVILMHVPIVGAGQDTLSDTTIVPGDRVGPIGTSTSEEDLRRLFGDTRVSRIDVNLGEGSVVPGTAIFADQPELRVEIVWRNSDRGSPKEVRLTGEHSKWVTEDGISLGTTLQEVESLNGYPFRLAGFGFDYGGTIVSCDRGRLAYLGCGDSGRSLVVRFAPGKEPQYTEYRQIIGDRVFSSGHPAMQAVNPVIYQLIVSVGET